MNFLTKPMSRSMKQVVTIAGFVLVLAGLPAMFGYLCITSILTLEGDSEAVYVGLVSFTLMAMTLGAGGAIFWHGLQSLRGKRSSSLYLPPAWMLAAIFGLLIIAGLSVSANDLATGLFFPPILLGAAMLPSLLAISWFADQDAGELTWRRGVLAFAGGTTISVVIVIILQLLLSALILALVFDLFNFLSNSLDTFFQALAGRDIAAAITSPGFIFIFIQVALIAPLVEELAKPLVVLPLVGRLSRRDTFLIGAMAGAGFAALENVLFAGFGFSFWAGILVVRALGGAIHPLGSGLVALGWRDILKRKTNAWENWFICFGVAVGMHAFWNGGSLLVITLVSAGFFGALPPEIDGLGLSAASTTLILLLFLGLAALWLGRSIAQRYKLSGPKKRDWAKGSPTLSDRAVAVWALACLAAIVPLGITGLQIFIR